MILFVDDEKRGIDNYVEELKLSGHEVVFRQDVDSAFKFLEENSDKITLVILDVMMPPGKLFRDGETHDGMLTGISFHKKIRKKFQLLPIIFFANFTGEELEKQIRHDQKSKLLEKSEYLPYELVEEIKTFLDEA